MSLTPTIAAEVEASLAACFGRPGAIAALEPVGGGCISPSARVETEPGDVAFLKRSGGAEPSGFFAEEARSLIALAEAGAVRVPRVLGVGEAWLLLEWLEPGSPDAAGWATLGESLAALHGHTTESWGWPADNWIGRLPQTNGWSGSWPAFWRERRLEPQLRLAYEAGHFRDERQRFVRLLDRIDELLGPAAEDGPSLLHGDLWSGNVHFLADGTAALIDPSTYYGHREVDLAMSELFGGFGRGFRDAYVEMAPLQPGYGQRRAVYQLYYLLVHVNLFGAGYLGSTLSALASVSA